MKKKLLIVSHALELGGAERSLIGLLSALNPNEYDIDLFLLRHEGELMGDIPPYVNLLPQIDAYTVLARPMKDILLEGHVLLTAARLYGKIKANKYAALHNHKDSGTPLEYSHKYTANFMPKIQPDTQYDLAISFLTPHYFVAQKVNAKRKIAWIHTDYSFIDIDVESELAMWSQYDYIVSISDAVTEGFIKTFPSLKDKIVLIENILPKDFILRKSTEFSVKDEMNFDGIKLLSIGRYCNAKNFDNVPQICSKILKSGINACWYIIGFGGDEELIKKKIEELSIQNNVVLLGKKENPYPYIKECDLYVQPSRYEGKSVTVREAQLLTKPVVITNYPTAKSQLIDGYDGIIAPLDNDGCADKIAEVLNNKNLINSICENCKANDYSNSNEVKKLEDILGE